MICFLTLDPSSCMTTKPLKKGKSRQYLCHIQSPTRISGFSFKFFVPSVVYHCCFFSPLLLVFLCLACVGERQNTGMLNWAAWISNTLLLMPTTDKQTDWFHSRPESYIFQSFISPRLFFVTFLQRIKHPLKSKRGTSWDAFRGKRVMWMAHGTEAGLKHKTGE